MDVPAAAELEQVTEARELPGTRDYSSIVLLLLAVQYASVNLIFTTYTQNIIILKDILAPFFSLLILATWVAGDLHVSGHWNLPRNGVVRSMAAALIGWGLLVPLSPDATSAVELWGRTFGYFVQTWALVRFADTEAKLLRLAKVVVVVNVLMIAYGLGQLEGFDLLVWLTLIPDWGSKVYVSTHGSPNFFSGVLICTLPLFVGLWFVRRSPLATWGLPVLILLNVYAVAATMNRSSFLAVLITTLVLLVFCLRWSFSDKPWRRRARIAFLLVLVVLSVELVREKSMAEDHKECGHRFIAAQASWFDYEGNYANRVRQTFFQMGLDGALRAPLLGRGLGSFNFLMPETRPTWYHRTGVSHNTDHPHNEHIEWIHDGGIFGLALFWLILVAYVTVGLRGARRQKVSSWYPLALLPLMGPVNQWIQASFDVETRWTGNNVTLWFMVGWVLAAGQLSRKETGESMASAPPEQAPPHSAQPPPEPLSPALSLSPPNAEQPPVRYPCRAAAAAGILLTITLAYAAQSWRYWQADHHLRNNMAFTDGGAGSVELAIEEAESARALNPASVSNYYKLAYSYLVGGRLNDALEAYRDLQAYAPNYAQIHINLAYLNDQMGFRSASAWERSRAAVIEHNVRNHRDAAQYWMTMGYPTRAIAHLRSCFPIELDRTEAGYWYWYDRDNVHADLARAYVAVGDTTAALHELSECLRYNPENDAAALVMVDMMRSPGDTELRNSISALLRTKAPKNPAFALEEMGFALRRRDYSRVLLLADHIAATWSIPAAAPSSQAVAFGNAVLAAVQEVYAAQHERGRCLEISGWVYAVQGRYEDAETFLTQAFNATRNPRTAERLGQVKSRLYATSRVDSR